MGRHDLPTSDASTDDVPEQATTTVDPQTVAPPAHWLRGRGELVLAAMLLAIAAVLAIGNVTMDVIGDGGLFGPAAFPWIITGVAVVLAALLVRSALTKPEQARREAAVAEADTNWVSFAVVLGALVAFTALLDAVGWILMATLLFTAVAEALGNRNHVTNVAVGFVLASVIQIVFSGVLDLTLPAGVFAGS